MGFRFKFLIEGDMGASVVAREFKDKVSRRECTEMIRLLGHIRSRALYCLADTKGDAGHAQGLASVISQFTGHLADSIEQVKEHHARE
jgi:hypothetical protein